ncbi:ABC transporter ATP-binding protein [Halorubrum luteum]
MVLELAGLTHRYGSELAVDDVSVSVEAGELVVLVGPSGCGKTTIVQAVAGHVRPTAGRIRLRGEDVTDAPPEEREVGIVFQQSTLYPHMTVAENVAYGLKARNVPPARRAETVTEHLDLVGLRDRRDALPAELSGGQKRRVELARALAPQPDVLVLDEPLSALDRALRERLGEEIARIQRETGVTTLVVTHNQEAALALADRLLVMSDGRIAGSGLPRRLYESPPNPFVGSFLGRSNTFPATVVGTDADAGHATVVVGDHRLTVKASDGGTKPGARTTLDHTLGDTVSCHVRPKDLSVAVHTDADTDIADDSTDGDTLDDSTDGDTLDDSTDCDTLDDSTDCDTSDAESSLPGEVVRVADIGRRYDITVRIAVEGGHEDVVVECNGPPPSVGDPVSVTIPADGLTVFGRDG